MADEVRDPGGVSRLWDELVRGEPASSRELEAGAAATVRQLHAMTAAPLPDQARARVRAKLDAHAAVNGPPRLFASAQPITRTAPVVRRPGFAWVMRGFATAFLLVVTLVAVSFTARQPRDRSLLAGTSTPPVGVAIVDLLTATLPVAALPADPADVVVLRLTGQPGASWAKHAQPETGIRIPYAEVQLAGVWTYRLDTPVSIARASGEQAEIPAGTVFSTQPGDVTIRTETGAMGEMRNDGTEAAVSLRVYIRTSVPMVDPSYTIWDSEIAPGLQIDLIDLMTSARWQQTGLGGGPVTVTIKQITLEPGAVLAPAADRFPATRFVLAGELTARMLKPGADAPDRPYVVRERRELPWTEFKPGATQILSNDGNQPVVYLETTFAPGA